MRAASDQFAVTVFASAEPLTTGPNNFAVLVQDVTSGQPTPDGDIEVSSRPIDRTGDKIYAARGVATNRLLEAATLNFASLGRWNVKSLVRKGGREFVLDSTVEVKSRVSER